MSEGVVAAPPSLVSKTLPSALTLSVDEGARVVALHWLYELMAARIAWAERIAQPDADSNEGTSDEGLALHRVRVALRRLRLTLEEHKRVLDLKDRKAYRLKLRQLNRATDASRDRDVQGAWLVESGSLLDAHVRQEALGWHRKKADAVATGDRRRIARAFARHLDSQALKLARELGQYRVQHTTGEDHHARMFAHRVADQLQAGSRRLDRTLARVAAVGSERQLHRLRMEFKRLRALLSLHVDVHEAIRRYYQRLTLAQDALGAMRDATLFAVSAERDGLLELATVLRSSAATHMAHFSAGWQLSGESVTASRDAAIMALRAVAEGNRAAETAADDATHVAAIRVDARLNDAPQADTQSDAAQFDAAQRADADMAAMARAHGLPIEIERKFLLHGLPPHAAMAPWFRIEQGWLPGVQLRERLRKSVSTSGDVVLTRTIKLGQPGARIEVEEPVEAALYHALWPLTSDARIHKRRHVVVDGALTWEVDVFLDRDLVLAEVELHDTAQELPIPAWLAPFIVKDVTHDPAYLNAVMARRQDSAPDRDRS